jgi:hypothetical protein
MREQYDLPIGKFERIMVRTRIVHIDLPEPGDLVGDRSLASAEKDKLEPGQFTLDLLVEADFRPGKKAHRQRGFFNRGKSACGGIPKLPRHQLITDLRGSGRDTMQTVIAHGRELLSNDAHRRSNEQDRLKFGPQFQDRLAAGESVSDGGSCEALHIR